jgi:hypothetical protein
MDVCPKEDDKVVGLGRVESLPIGLGRDDRCLASRKVAPRIEGLPARSVASAWNR